MAKKEEEERKKKEEEEEGEEEEEKEEEEEEILPSSIAPAILSRAGRKRAPTLKALEAEKTPKRATRQGRVGRGRGRGKGKGKGEGS